MPAPASLFGADIPEGFLHRDDFVTVEEESALLAETQQIEFSTFEMRGVVARRRVAFFGFSYDKGDAPSRPLPEFLFPLRTRLAAWAGVAPDAFAMSLINEYRPGAPIGWHRDAPNTASLPACRCSRRAGCGCDPTSRHATRQRRRSAA